MIVAKRLTARGRVQGVWYRASTEKEARALGLKGWVRNLPDGSVEAHAEGEESAVALLLAWMRVGPPLARVTEVEEQPAKVEGCTDFRTRY